jgi:hypothetical protein
MERVDGDRLRLTGEGGFLPDMIEAVLDGFSGQRRRRLP